MKLQSLDRTIHPPGVHVAILGDAEQCDAAIQRSREVGRSSQINITGAAR